MNNVEKNKLKPTRKTGEKLWDRYNYNSLVKFILPKLKKVVNQSHAEKVDSWLYDILLASIQVIGIEAEDIKRDSKISKKTLQRKLDTLLEKYSIFFDLVCDIKKNFKSNVTNIRIALLFIEIDSSFNGDFLEYYRKNEKVFKIEELFNKSTEDCIDLFWEEKVKELESFYKYVGNNFASIRNTFDNYLKKIELEGIQKFSLNVQDFIQEKVRKESIGIKLTPGDESQSIWANQLALTLLKSWESQFEGEKSQESFISLKVYTEKYTPISFFSSVGEVAPYNGQLYIANQPVSDRQTVKIIKPGVLWDDGKRKKIIFKALVTPTGE